MTTQTDNTLELVVEALDAIVDTLATAHTRVCEGRTANALLLIDSAGLLAEALRGQFTPWVCEVCGADDPIDNVHTCHD